MIKATRTGRQVGPMNKIPKKLKKREKIAQLGLPAAQLRRQPQPAAANTCRGSPANRRAATAAAAGRANR